MQLTDGFIDGVFNYCDRWCERCAFTSHCRLFADVAESEAELDPALKALVDAPPLPQEAPPPTPQWMEELIEDMNRASQESASLAREAPADPRAPSEYEHLSECAMAYVLRVHRWLQDTGSNNRRCSPADPREVIAWFHTMISAKIHRAVRGFADDRSEDDSGPPDYDGSAKVALLGIEESHAAWQRLIEEGQVRAADVQPMVADLVWLGEELERLFPRARRFVRPAFDEPDAVTRMLAP